MRAGAQMIAVALGSALAVLACAVVAAVGGDDAALTSANSDAGQQFPARDAIWRSIFARPNLPPPSTLDYMATARIALGRTLFEDARLSGPGTRACASCHRQELGFTDGLIRPVGLNGELLKRNTPHLWNLAFASRFDWDGRAGSLEEQALRPLLSRAEMAADVDAVARRFASDADMRARFVAAFPGPDPITSETIRAALAAYVRTLVSPPTRFDRWVEGDDVALTAEELAGLRIFVGKGGCVACHGGWRFTDDDFHDIGLPVAAANADLGRGALPGGRAGVPHFKTPGLRDVARTAPYMHDGSLATLQDVIGHYAGGIIARPSLATNLVRDLELTDEERAHLIAFLRTL